MPKIVLLFALFLLFPQQPPRRGRTPAEMEAEARAAQAEMQREEVYNLELETARAMQLHNATFFQRVYGDDYLGTTSFGQLVDKTQLIRTVQNPEPKYVSFIASDIRIRVFQDTAVVTSLWSTRATVQGQTVSRQSRVIHVYVNGMRGWKAVSGQETVLPGQGH
jgi:ketosteroid isomerase-like protein